MIRESDVQWWILEAIKHPESTPEIIEELAKRLIELDTENEQLRGEIIRLRQHAPSMQPQPAVQALKQQVETLQKALRHQSSGAPSLLLLGDRLEAGRTSLAQAQQWSDQDRPLLNMRAALSLRQIISAKPGDELLLVTNLARAYRRMSADIPELDDKGRWPGPPQDTQLEDAERLTTAVAMQPPPRLWTVVTRQGYVQRLVWAGMERNIAQDTSLLSRLDRRDAPIALVPGDQGDLAVFTRWGQAIRFPLHTIETQGSMALELDPDDQVVAALALSGDLGAPGHEILLVTASGRGLRRDVVQLPARSRPGGTTGKTLINARDLLAVFAPLQSQLIFATYSGKMVFASVESAARHDRLAQGSRLCDLDHDPAVAVTQIP